MIGTRTQRLLRVCMAILGCASTLASQEAPPVAELLSCFEARHGGTPEARHCQAGPTAEAVMLHASSYDASTVAGVFAGLFELAKSSPNPDVRLEATIWLGTAGRRFQAPEDRITGVVSTLRELYFESDDGAVRSWVLRELYLQHDIEATIELLMDIAREDRPEDRRAHSQPPAFEAIQALLSKGEPGRAALRTLYEEGSVTNPWARGRLQRLADNDFRAPR